MQKKYAREGLVVIPVAVDTDPDAKERAKWRDKTNEYLAERKYSFPTYDLEFDRAKPPPAVTWADATPRVFVFNRDNQYLLRLPVTDDKREVVKPAEHEDIEKAIAEAVKQK